MWSARRAEMTPAAMVVGAQLHDAAQRRRVMSLPWKPHEGERGRDDGTEDHRPRLKRLSVKAQASGTRKVHWKKKRDREKQSEQGTGNAEEQQRSTLQV